MLGRQSLDPPKDLPKTLMPQLSGTRGFVLALLPRNLLDAMQAAGLDTAALALKLGLAPEQLETRLSFDAVDRFGCAAWTAIGDPAFGLKAGGQKRPERFGVVGFAAMTSPTFGVALARMVRYIRLVWGDPHELQRQGSEITVRLLGGPERPYSQGKLDYELASLLTFGRLFTGEALRPLWIAVRGPAPAYAAHYTELFDCPVRFNQSHHSICFAERDTERRLISANAAVAGQFEHCAELGLSQLHEVDLASRVRAALRGMLRGDEPTLAAVASELHLSIRTLQRRLGEAELSFRELLDEARHELALQHLRSGLASLMEISYLLGFADPNSFFRAFKRWTGTTPDGYRSAQGGRPASG